MATKTILVQRKFCIYSTFLDTTLQAEDERLEGESIEDGIMRVHKQLEQTADCLRKEANPHLCQDSKTHEIEGIKQWFRDTADALIKQVPIISQDQEKKEDTLTEIQNAPTIEILKTFKVIASSDPSKVLYNAYCQRIKELSNG